MKKERRWLRLAAVWTAWCAVAALAPMAQAAAAHETTLKSSATLSEDASAMVAWVHRTHDAAGKPFAVVDKRHARIHVFTGDGRLVGSSPVLLGQTLGDETVPGVGARAQAGKVGVDERTTPAGRFEAEPGRNLSGERIVWVDYESAFAIHRVRPGRTWKMRAARLATADPADKRVSWGCVVVPVPFYLAVVEKVLGASRSVVYVLPETKSLATLLSSS